jgi:isopentenyl-diphosphate Delta-isomerase
MDGDTQSWCLFRSINKCNPPVADVYATFTLYIELFMEEVILVNEKDEEIGLMEKMEAHRKGLLHRAFSILVFNSKGELLLQKRANGKYHSKGLWSNTCCSHPRKGETVYAAAQRRLKEEMGFTCELEVKGSFIYKTELPEGLTENEYDYVLAGYSDAIPVVDPNEACDYKYINREELVSDINLHPSKYTFWIAEIMRQGYL